MLGGPHPPRLLPPRGLTAGRHSQEWGRGEGGGHTVLQLPQIPRGISGGPRGASGECQGNHHWGTRLEAVVGGQELLPPGFFIASHPHSPNYRVKGSSSTGLYVCQ